MVWEKVGYPGREFLAALECVIATRPRLCSAVVPATCSLHRLLASLMG